MSTATATRPELLETMLAVRGGGVSVIPVQHWDKRPYNDLLPALTRGQADMGAVRQEIASEEVVRKWANSGLRSYAGVCGRVSGGLVIIDFDEARLYEPWLKAIGSLATDLVIQKTGGGGYQIAFRCDEPCGNEKMAWVPDEAEDSGRHIGIETRGEGGYAVLAPSDHPSGNRYQITAGSFAEIQHVPQAVADALLAAARKLDEAPKTRRELEAEARKAHAKGQKRTRASLNGEASVIDEFNRRYPIEAILEQQGYLKGATGRYIRPGGESESVSVKDGRSCHWSTDDPLNDGKGKVGCGCHDAFDVFRILNHGGDFTEAVRAAANAMGLGTKHTARSNEQEDDECRASELRNAELVCQQNRADIRFNVDRREWMIWTGSHWKRDTTGYVSNLIKAVARQTRQRLIDAGDSLRNAERTATRMESAAGVAGVEKLLRSEPPLPVTADAFDRDDFALNALNGTIDLRTGKLSPHNPDDLITHVLPFEFDPAAPAPRWTQFLAEITGGDQELQGYLCRKAGLYASGDTTVQEFDVFHGAGANGKSVFIDTLLYMLGDYAGVAPESLLMARRNQEHPTELAALWGKRLVVASETEEGGTLRLQLVKRLTGDEKITARFMRQDFFTFRRTHKLLMVTNNKPRVPESSEAAWRRIRLFPFDVTIPPEQRDENLLAKLKAEAPGILAWIVRGSVERIANGMQTPARVIAATTAYRDESDRLAEFLADRCILGAVDVFRVSRAELFAAYGAWMKAASERHPLERGQLYDAVRKVQCVEEASWKTSGGHVPVRGFRGIGLVSTREDGWSSEA